MPVGVEPLPPLEVVLEEVEVVADVGLWVEGLVPRLLEEVVDGRLTVDGRETDVDGRLTVDGRETDVDGRLTVDGRLFNVGAL